MKIYLDTNVFADMLIARENRQDNINAMMLLGLVPGSKFEFCISPLTVATCFYLLRKEKDAAEHIKERLKNMTIVPVAENDVKFSIFFNFPDREDSMHMSCAVNAGCELILTRNGAHYKNGPLSAYSPAEFLKIIRR